MKWAHQLIQVFGLVDTMNCVCVCVVGNMMLSSYYEIKTEKSRIEKEYPPPGSLTPMERCLG